MSSEWCCCRRSFHFLLPASYLLATTCHFLLIMHKVEDTLSARALNCILHGAFDVVLISLLLLTPTSEEGAEMFRRR